MLLLLLSVFITIISNYYYNLFLTNPIKILYLLEFKFKAPTRIKNLQDFIPISGNQMNESLNSLQRKKNITRKRTGRETIITITERGRNFIKTYHLTVDDFVIQFYNFLLSINAIDKLNENENENTEENKKKPLYYMRVYQLVEKGIVKKTTIHEIFDYLNKHPDISVGDLQSHFPDKNPGYIRNLYSIWFNLTKKIYSIS